MKNNGKIIRQISNQYTVICNNHLYDCVARGKFRNVGQSPKVGDFVIFDSDEGVILEILPRINELKRPSIVNVDIALIITSVIKPDINLSLLDRQLVAILNEGIEPIICISKTDIIDSDNKKEIKRIMKMYRSIGFKVITNKQIFKLKRLLRNKTVVLTGQTGAGKSTLLNKLDKRLNLETNPISEALGRGVHTTRHTELYKIGNILIADTPGFSALDLDIDKSKLKTLFPEFNGLTCKYDDCMHINEKGCMVKSQVESGKINKSRYDNYVKFWGELK